ncbi:hypothetical protein [Cellulomonas sp. ATA003]|uniref:hypothetical protein n=1 Tax=Cellulomonas sp. ATA003 TaxID=3073064 RepID=UPI002873C293|nr:hypothetical protein [Cellulomonas sp. ATA003]WNB85008.1 hypothetical protein REH70_15160 [Cellulomonas sp. ATA003]
MAARAPKTPGAVPASLRTLPPVVVERGALTSTVLEGVAALAVPVAPPVEGETELQPRSGTADAAALYGVDLAEVAERAGATGAAGDAWTLHLPRRLLATASAFPWESLPDRLVLVGVGSGSPTDLRRAGAALARATRGLGRVVTTLGSEGGRTGRRGAGAGRGLPARLLPHPDRCNRHARAGAGRGAGPARPAHRPGDRGGRVRAGRGARHLAGA